MVSKPTNVFWLLVFGLGLMSLACGLQGQLRAPNEALSDGASLPSPTPLITPTLSSQLPTPLTTATTGPDPSQTSAASVYDSSTQGWQRLREGLERRLVQLPTDEGGVQEQLYILRVDPAMYEFDVGYRPGAPQRLMDWQRETGALIVVNGGFFTAEQQATGLIIVDGQAYGSSYSGFGGMLAITDDGPEIRALQQQPYDPYEQLQAAVQSFPILVVPGGEMGYTQEDGLVDRRTVIAQDRQGRILFVVAPTGSLTLHELSRYLVESELDLWIALNLDGGASSGIQLADPVEGIAPFSLLPIVITVKAKG